jgi:hypothetical protein
LRRVMSIIGALRDELAKVAMIADQMV